MSIAAPTLPHVAPGPYRLSVRQYEEMTRLGVLTKDDRVELIEGILVEKMPKNEKHVTTTWLFHQAFSRALPEGWFVANESPILLPRSVPEPDVMVIRGRIQDYFRRKPTPKDVALVIEVADSSYADDLERLGYYAESGILIYWIAHIRAGRIEVYSDPTGVEYRSRQDYGWDEAAPLHLDGTTIARLNVRDLLAPIEPA